MTSKQPDKYTDKYTINVKVNKMHVYMYTVPVSDLNSRLDLNFKTLKMSVIFLNEGLEKFGI